MGRFTHQETSSAMFTWPAREANNPLVANLEFDPDYLPRQKVIKNSDTGETYAGNRIGEDILLTNVDAFDVKVWDEGLGRFVDIGHGDSGGHFAATEDLNDNYGPRGSGNNVFDTWHPNAPVGTADPPYRPLTWKLDAPSVQEWTSEQTYGQGAVVRPRGNLTWKNSRFVVTDLDAPDREIGNGSTLYRAVSGGTSGAVQPAWPRRPGERVSDGGVLWEAFDNRVGLKMIQLTIRYRDPGSNLARQLTIVHSFVE